MNKTTIAMVLGDPAGIGPELIARLLAEQSRDQFRADAGGVPQDHRDGSLVHASLLKGSGCARSMAQGSQR